MPRLPWFSRVTVPLRPPVPPSGIRRHRAPPHRLPTQPPRHSQRGFTLLEVLIALLIAGLALGAVFRAAAEGGRATSVAARYQEAISRAHSHLDGTGAFLAPGDQEGDDGAGFHWRTVVRVTDSTGKRDASGQPIASEDALVVNLYAVTVWITWRDGATTRTVRLDSERLATAVPAGRS
jgi:general secretion pathway protein I